MEIKQWIYTFLLLGFLLIPLITDLKRKNLFYPNLKYLLPAILFTGAIFILWDIRFTETGIWTFNPEFLSRITILNLPAEEWLFFLAIPGFSVFIYEYVKIKFRQFEKNNFFVAVSLVLLVVFGVLAWFSRKQLYPFFTFFLLTVYFGYTIFRNRFKQHLTKFYLAFAISVIPFFILRTITTSLPVISFNAGHTAGVLILNMPVEDFGYFFLLFLMNVTIYEYLKERKYY
jgi:lycopene cyclase domain-containing protein